MAPESLEPLTLLRNTLNSSSSCLYLLSIGMTGTCRCDWINVSVLSKYPRPPELYSCPKACIIKVPAPLKWTFNLSTRFLSLFCVAITKHLHLGTWEVKMFIGLATLVLNYLESVSWHPGKVIWGLPKVGRGQDGNWPFEKTPDLPSGLIYGLLSLRGVKPSPLRRPREFTQWGAAPVVWLPPTGPWHLSEVPTEHCHTEDKLPARERLKNTVKPYILSGFQMSAL